jgi:hypothetical protein
MYCNGDEQVDAFDLHITAMDTHTPHACVVRKGRGAGRDCGGVLLGIGALELVGELVAAHRAINSYPSDIPCAPQILC